MDNQSDIPKPDYDDPKEVYAFFGLAFYTANVLEHGVLNLAVALLAKDVAGVEAVLVEKLYESFDKKTFGQIINAAKIRFQFSDSIASELKTALDYRNYLAHRYFIVHDIDFLTDSGRRKMLDELVGILKYLKEVDRKMDEIWKSAWEDLGITQEWLAEKEQEFMANIHEKNV